MRCRFSNRVSILCVLPFSSPGSRVPSVSIPFLGMIRSSPLPLASLCDLMKMPQSNLTSLWSALSASEDLSSRFLFSAEGNNALSDLVGGSALYGHCDELRGRSVVIATTSQLATTLALIDLDGVARRVILYPPDLSLEHLTYVIDSTGADAIVSDGRATDLSDSRIEHFVPCNGKITPWSGDRTPQ